MTKKAQASRKCENGSGDILTVFFDPDDPQEARALEMAKLLAQKHGRRKSTVVALLDSMYRHYQATGELLSATDIATAVGSIGVGRGAIGFTSAVSRTAETNSETA